MGVEVDLISHFIVFLTRNLSNPQKMITFTLFANNVLPSSKATTQ